MENRKSPEEILRKIHFSNLHLSRGKLTIFLGYAAGVGKTYAMLKYAHKQLSNGKDIVCGYIEAHDRCETTALLEGLETIAPLQPAELSSIRQEFNLDAALERHPEIILVDELAHTNLKVCRHQKRYQDINELLAHGIDVYTTINIQHLESLNDVVSQITGIQVNERVPDSIFDDAFQVKLIDIEPTDLINRLKEGKVYHQDQATKALEHFFTVSNLESLREIALRRTADRLNYIASQSNSDSFTHRTEEHVLVCISTSPSNPNTIRTAARMATAFKGQFTALFVETSSFLEMNDQAKEQLRQNIHLAKKLGARIETVYGDDIPLLISSFCKTAGVTKLNLGRSHQHKSFFNRQSLTSKISQLAPNLEIYIIPDSNDTYVKRSFTLPKYNTKDLLISVLVLFCTTLIGLLFDFAKFSPENMMTIYIFSVLVIAMTTESRLYSILSSIMSVLLLNFFFIRPKYTLTVYDGGYITTFFIMFMIAFLTSGLASQMKKNHLASTKNSYQLSILFETNQLLTSILSEREIIDVTCHQLSKLFNKSILFYQVSNHKLLKPLPYLLPLHSLTSLTSPAEQAVANWVLHNNKHAGATTNTLMSSQCLYLSVRIQDEVFGVIAIVIDGKPLDAFQNDLLHSILGECALSIKNKRILEEREASVLVAKNEQLRADLLRSISHDLRTPLTAISGNAQLLLQPNHHLSNESMHRIYTDIYNDAHWLNDIFENMLSITKIDYGKLHLNLSSELLDDIITSSIHKINQRTRGHQINYLPPDIHVFVNVDVHLMIQVIINLIDNAIKYTPDDSVITISFALDGDKVCLTVKDNGPGVSEGDLPQLFDMFFTSSHQIKDSHRHIGLGLYLCKAIIEAHEGYITVSNVIPNGLEFNIYIDVKEVIQYE